MNVNLSTSAFCHSSHLAAFSEDGPVCGTHPPGLPPPPQPDVLSFDVASRLSHVALNPQPLPPREAKNDSPQSILGEAMSSTFDHMGSLNLSASDSVRQDGDDIPLCPASPPRLWLDSFGQVSLQVLNALGLPGSQTPGQDRGIIIVSG
jgi:hypothetical protein